jgi:branched-chain amino acid transport system substrate-binding protein
VGLRAPTAFALAVAALIAGCGGSHRPSTATVTNSNGLGLASTTKAPKPAPPPELRIVASLPLVGPDATRGTSVENAMKLAFASWHGRAGDFRVDFIAANDATRDMSWDPVAVAAIARDAADREGTIAYLGELASGAAQVSLPILSAAGIPVVLVGSPDTQLLATGSVGAADRGQADEGAPAPAYVRLVPSNVHQAAAELRALTRFGCTRVAVAYGSDPKDVDATDVVEQLKRQAAAADPSITLLPAVLDPTARSRFAATLSQWTHAQVNCAVYAGSIQEGAVAATVGLHTALAPGGKIIGSSAVCTSAWTDPARGGVPARIDPDLFCTAPGRGLSTTPAGRRFAQLYRRRYRIAPDPAAIYGYEAMSIVLEAIAGLRVNGDDRGDVAGVLRNPIAASALGPITFSETTGDTTSTTYSLYRVARGGTLELDHQPAVTTSTTTTSTTSTGQPVGKHQPG